MYVDISAAHVRNNKPIALFFIKEFHHPCLFAVPSHDGGVGVHLMVLRSELGMPLLWGERSMHGHRGLFRFFLCFILHLRTNCFAVFISLQVILHGITFVGNNPFEALSEMKENVISSIGRDDKTKVFFAR